VAPIPRFLLGFFLGWVLCALSAAAEQLPIRAYGIQDGLASDSVTFILRDSRGYLWFATTDGVSRFDGERFTSYSAGDGLPHARVEQILEARDGTVWLATRGGLARFIAGRPAGRPAFAAVPWTSGKTPREPVYALYEDRGGRLWVGGEGRLAVFEPGTGTPARDVPLRGLALPAGRIGGFAETADGSLWIGCEGGLLRRLPDGASVSYPVLPHHGTDSVLGLAVDGAGRLWIAHALGAFVLVPEPASAAGSGGPRASLAEQAERTGAVLTPGRPARLPRAPGEVCALATATNTGWHRVFPAADGRVWLATSRGLVGWDEKRGLSSWGPENGLPEPGVTAVAEDRAGNLWMGTASSGALRLARRGLAGFTVRDGLADARVNTLLNGKDGALYVRSGDTLDSALFLHRFDGSRFTGLRPRLPAGAAYLGWGDRQTMVQSRTGEWWLATGQGLLRYPAVPFAALATTAPTLLTTRDGLGGNSIARLFEDSRGDLWIASFGAHPLTRREQATGTFRIYGPADGLSGLPAAFAEDRSGAVWIGLADGGLARLRGGSRAGGGHFEAFGPAEGVPPGRVHELFVDHAGRLWVATEDGAARLDAPNTLRPRLTPAAPRGGLSSSDVRCVTEDTLGRIYLGGRKGVDRLDPASGRIERFTTADGLLGNVVDSALRDRDGNLWFGTRRGLSRLVPARDRPVPPPATWITAVRVDGVSRVVSELGVPSVSGPDLEVESRLEVESLALDFKPRAALRYQHKMEGVDADWSTPAAARVVQYAELPEGWQRFQVRAVTRDGAVGPPGVVIFHVEPPLWRRGWVMALAALGVALAGIGFYGYRLSHLVAIERMRTRIATDLHDDLGSSLTRVSILSEVARRRVADDGESSRLLTEIGGAAREMIEALGESIWAIDPRRDDLRSFVTRVRRFAGGLLDGSGIAWQLRAPQESELIKLSPVERRQLFLLVKEALHNVARHSQAAAVTIHLAASGRRLTVEIRDDGRGFDPAAVAPEAGGSGGQGLRSMRERAAALGARLEIDTAPGRGTRLFLETRLPVLSG
jgi:ligand-binding sensor domain-containing protein/signal transduction histidine kinase